MRKIIGAALAVSALLCAVPAAQAQDAPMQVTLAGLDLATDAGARTALTRIELGAASFCESNVGGELLERASVIDRCVADMTARSVRQLNSPLVTALLRGRVIMERQQLAMAQ